jgi:hypothetical protein
LDSIKPKLREGLRMSRNLTPTNSMGEDRLFRP